MNVHALTLFALCTAVGSCAAPGSDNRSHSPVQGLAANDCFSSSFISGYETVDDHTIRVRASVKDRYDIVFSGGRCDQLDWSQRLAIETPATSQLCVGKSLGQGTLAFRDPVSRRRIECHIDEVRRAAN
jgi:hypothetical protein